MGVPENPAETVPRCTEELSTFRTEIEMPKSTTTYWNPLAPDQRTRWTPIKDLEGMAEEITLSLDPGTGEYTRLTRFLPGADTSAFGENPMHTQRRFLL